MPTTVYDETFDGKGNLISSTPRIVDNGATTDNERIAKLEATLDAVGNAADFAAAKAEIATRITKGDVRGDGEREEPIGSAISRRQESDL